MVKRNIAGVSLKLSISRAVYQIHEADWLSSSTRSSWQKIAELPSDRENFTVTSVDNTRTIYVVGSNFCDILDVKTGEWRSV
jgi:hypothetical protein